MMARLMVGNCGLFIDGAYRLKLSDEQRSYGEQVMAQDPITAKTIGELRDALDKIIQEHGADMEWNGFDDESIYIYPGSGDYSNVFEIRPGDSRQ